MAASLIGCCWTAAPTGTDKRGQPDHRHHAERHELARQREVALDHKPERDHRSRDDERVVAGVELDADLGQRLTIVRVREARPRQRTIAGSASRKTKNSRRGRQHPDAASRSVVA